jgi:hypothetical protein
VFRTTVVATIVLGLAGWANCDTVRAGDPAELATSIDRLIQARLDADQIEPVPAADDAEFLRRVYLDLHGVVPTAEQAAQFLTSAEPHKRSQLIDQLLADSRFGEHLADVWRGRLISPLVNEQRQQTERFAAWLAERFNANDGWDRIVFDLMTATGKMEDNPAVTYLIEGRNPLGVTDLTDLSSRYFLGIRLNCAQCHDHPFVEWKQHEYWGMAAFFAQIQTPGRPKMVYMAGVQDDPKMTLAALRDADMIEGYRQVQPTFLGSSEPAETGPKLRPSLARWATSPDNPYFARAAVNRLWWQFFGRGIVNPVDDMHAGNPPSHPELLELLSQQFIESGFDLKFLSRAILNSDAYQRTSRPGEHPEREAELFARMSIKVLTPEQLYDSLVQVLGPPAKTPSINTRLGARHEFCQYFAGDGESDPTRYERGIPHLLRLMNSPQFAGRSVAALAAQIDESQRSTEKVADELFLTILSRRATMSERDLVRDKLADEATSPSAALRELAWALLLSSEFSLNH